MAILVFFLGLNPPLTCILPQCQLCSYSSHSNSWIKPNWAFRLQLSTCLPASHWCVTHLRTVVTLRNTVALYLKYWIEACQICIKPAALRSFSCVFVKNHNHPLTNDNHNNGLLAGLYHKVVLVGICIIVLSIYMPVGSGAAISCCREVSDWWSTWWLKNSRKLCCTCVGVLCMCVFVWRHLNTQSSDNSEITFKLDQILMKSWEMISQKNASASNCYSRNTDQTTVASMY